MIHEGFLLINCKTYESIIAFNLRSGIQQTVHTFKFVIGAGLMIYIITEYLYCCCLFYLFTEFEFTILFDCHGKTKLN